VDHVDEVSGIHDGTPEKKTRLPVPAGVFQDEMICRS